MEEITKARKGTPEYEEWLRKYREKRQKKEETQNAPAKKPSFADSLKELVSSKKAVTQQDLFDQAAQEPPKESKFDKYEVPEHSAAPLPGSQQDIRVKMQRSSDIAQVHTSPELLQAATSPVFANLFGNYPVHALNIQNREVTSEVEEVDVALAEEPDEISDEIWNSPKWIPTEKVDGCRATIICTPEATRITGRRQQVNVGKKKPADYTNNLPHIRDIDLYSVLGDTIIDSESVASNPIEIQEGKWGDSLASTMSILGQEKDKSVCVERMEKYGPIIQMCFDIQRFQGHDLRQLPYSERMVYLDKALSLIKDKFGSEYIKKVASKREDESKKDFFLRVTGGNGEGLVLANADGPYKAFDRKNRLKAKRQVELTLQVMDILEGVGRNKNQAGSFVMGAYINGILTPVCNLNVGEDALRKDVWENKDKYLGRLIETKAMQMTLGSGKQGQPRLRHARFKSPGMFRDDKELPDDISDVIAVMKRRRDTGK